MSVVPRGWATSSRLSSTVSGVMLKAYSHFCFSLFPTFAKEMNLTIRCTLGTLKDWVTRQNLNILIKMMVLLL